MNREVFALIPARGGSKGIPRKNLQSFGKGNLLTHKINQSIEAGINEVFVSSDDEEIINVALKSGAKIINRPREFASDTASTDQVINHALSELTPGEQDLIVLLQVTSPLLKPESIKKCIEKLDLTSDLSCVFTAHLAHPFMWFKENDESDYWEPKHHSRSVRLRRQELGIGGWETGGCYAIKVQSLINQKVRYPHPTSIVPVTFLESLDIDTQEDLVVARQIFENIGI